MKADLVVVGATHLEDHTLVVSFSNGVNKEVDFSGFFENNEITYLNKYKAVRSFKKFKVEDGNIVWGKDWDLIFPVDELYSGEVK